MHRSLKLIGKAGEAHKISTKSVHNKRRIPLLENLNSVLSNKGYNSREYDLKSTRWENHIFNYVVNSDYIENSLRSFPIKQSINILGKARMIQTFDTKSGITNWCGSRMAEQY
jgi:hypothetical protein